MIITVKLSGFFEARDRKSLQSKQSLSQQRACGRCFLACPFVVGQAVECEVCRVECGSSCFIMVYPEIGIPKSQGCHSIMRG